MNDCPNAEMRDLLPDLLHNRLSATVRAEVTAHVDSCFDCREELALLRDVHGMLMARAPRVDVSYVVNALPKPRARVQVKPAPRRTWADWRIAAAVTMIAVGGTSVVVARNGAAPAANTAIVAAPPTSDTVVPAVAATPDSSPTIVASTSATNAAATANESGSLGMSGHLSDLDESQLKSLIDEIEQMQAVPLTEPEPVSIKVDARLPLPEGDE